MASLGSITFDVILRNEKLGVDGAVGTLEVPLTLTNGRLDGDAFVAEVVAGLGAS